MNNNNNNNNNFNGNNNNFNGNNNKQPQQTRINKPSQPIYRPPSARIDAASATTTMMAASSSSTASPSSSALLAQSISGPNLSTYSSSSINQQHQQQSHQQNNNYPSDIFLIKQPNSNGKNSDVFPIRGVLKRSKSFGNNNNNNNSDDCSNNDNGANNNNTNTNNTNLNKIRHHRNHRNHHHNQSKYHYLDEQMIDSFYLSLDHISKDNLMIIKQALNRQTCSALSMQQLLQIIRLLCNKVLEKSIDSSLIAKICLEIHYNQQISKYLNNKNNTSSNNNENESNYEHRYIFLESLANCLREWFNERDKLRFTTGGARRWTNYIQFLMELYLNLKKTNVKDYDNRLYFSDSNDDDFDDYDDDDDDDDVHEYGAGHKNMNKDFEYKNSNISTNSNNNNDDIVKSINNQNTIDSNNNNLVGNDDEDDDDDDDDLDFDLSQSFNNKDNNLTETSSINDSTSQGDCSSLKSGSSERCLLLSSSATSLSSSMKKSSSSQTTNNQCIEMKIMNSLLSKQQKQFANLLLDSFNIILINPNSTPAEIECMQMAFHRCGKYLDEDNPSKIKSIIFLLRDILLNYNSNSNLFINAHNNYSLNSLISKNLLEIIELYSSGWQFNQTQQIYYFPYTKID